MNWAGSRIVWQALMDMTDTDATVRTSGATRADSLVPRWLIHPLTPMPELAIAAEGRPRGPLFLAASSVSLTLQPWPSRYKNCWCFKHLVYRL